MNGDKKSLGELINTMNSAKVDPNVGMSIFYSVLTKPLSCGRASSILVCMGCSSSRDLSPFFFLKFSSIKSGVADSFNALNVSS